MDEDNKELFLEMLLKLDGSHESIKAASKWCRANAQHHLEIVRMWLFAVAKSRTMERRLDLFYLASDILFTADSYCMQFFCSFLPQLVQAIPLIRGDEIKLSVKKLFILWREKNIYNNVVMNHLDRLLRNRNKVVDKNLFVFDKRLLFEDLRRVKEVRPACDILVKGLEHQSNSYENSTMLLAPIKHRRNCEALLSEIDTHKRRTTALVSYLEEMVHILKTSSGALDLAANYEQNCAEETKLKLKTYGAYRDKTLNVLHMLESTHNISKSDVIPSTPRSPDPEEETLYSRRPGTLVSPLVPPFLPPTGPPPIWAPPPGFTPNLYTETSNETMFHRRDPISSSTPTREDVPWSPASPSYTGASPWAPSGSWFTTPPPNVSTLSMHTPNVPPPY